MNKFQTMLGTRVVLVLGGGLSMSSLRREEGQTLAEYALILALIAAVVAGALIFLKDKITGLFTTIGNSL